MRRSLWVVVALWCAVAWAQRPGETNPAILNGVRYAHQYATSGSGTVGAPWVGWTAAFAANTTVHLKVGYYRVTAFATIPAGMVLEGEGEQSRIIFDQTGTPDAGFINAANAGDITIRNLYVDHDGNTAASTRSTFEFTPGTGQNYLFENVHIYDAGEDGIRVDGGTAGTPTNVKVIGCTVDTAKRHGIEIGVDVSQAEVSNNYVRNVNGNPANHGVGIFASGNWTATQDTLFVTISNNTVTGAENCIRGQGRDIAISNNTVTACLVDGIRLRGIRMTATGNVVKDVTESGIKVEDGTDFTVSGNVVSGSDQDGILVRQTVGYSKPERVAITGNTTTGSTLDGIAVIGGKDVTVSGNTVSGNTRYGINIEAFHTADSVPPEVDRILVEGNTVTANGTSADIIVRKTGTPNGTIGEVVVRGNYVNGRSATSTGISAGADSASVSVLDNTVLNHTVGEYSIAGGNLVLIRGSGTGDPRKTPGLYDKIGGARSGSTWTQLDSSQDFHTLFVRDNGRWREVAPQYRNANDYATGGAGTSGDPWTGWETAFDGADGRKIEFPPGYYRPPNCTSDTCNALTLGSNTIIQGHGIQSKIVVGPSWTNGNLFYAQSEAFITIRDLYLEGPNPTSGSSSNEAIQFVGVADSLIENCEMTKWRHGVALNQDTLATSLVTKNTTVRGNYIHDYCSLGITLKYGPSNNNLIESNRIVMASPGGSCSPSGISCTHDCDDNTFRSNDVSGTGGSCIGVAGLGIGGAGVTSDGNLIEGNRLRGCANGGVVLGDDAGLYSTNTGNRVIGNNIGPIPSGSGGSGIVGSRVQKAIIANNVVHDVQDSSGVGIVLAATYSGSAYDINDNVIEGNTIYSTAGHAIRVNGAGGGADGQRNVVSDNTVNAPGLEGINLVLLSGATVTGNSVYSSGTYGIYLNGVDRATVEGNVIHSGGTTGTYAGIRVASVSTSRGDDNTIIGNNVRGMSGVGIEIADSNAAHNVLQGNTLFSNTGGAWSDLGTNTTAGPNKVTTADGSIYLGSAKDADISLTFDQLTGTDPRLVWDDTPGQFEFDFDGALNDGADPTISTDTVKSPSFTSGTGTVDFGTAGRTAPMRVATSAPSSCTLGDVWFDSDVGVPGENLMCCTVSGTPGTWKTCGDGGDNVQIAGSAVNGTVNFPDAGDLDWTYTGGSPDTATATVNGATTNLFTVGTAGSSDVCVEFDTDWLPEIGPPPRSDPSICYDYSDDSFNFGGLRLSNLTDPSGTYDAATKNYVDLRNVSTLVFGNYSISTVDATSTGETSMVPTGSGSVTIPGGRINAGDAVRFDISGFIDKDDIGVYPRIRVYWGSVSIADTGADSAPTYYSWLKDLGTGSYIKFRIHGMTSNYGALMETGHAATQSEMLVGGFGTLQLNSSTRWDNQANIGSQTIDFSSSQEFKLTADYLPAGSGTSFDKIVVTNFTLEKVTLP